MVAPVAPHSAYLNRQLGKWRKQTTQSFEASCLELRRGRNSFDSCQCQSPAANQNLTFSTLLLLDTQLSTTDQHVDFTRKERELVSTFDRLHSTQQMADDIPSLYLDRMRRFTSILIYTADLSHSEITLRDVPKLKYTLRLLVDNEEKELRKMDNQTWEPAQRLYAHAYLIGALSETCVPVEMHLRHPRCVSRFK